jgi:hypothetical protein
VTVPIVDVPEVGGVYSSTNEIVAFDGLIALETTDADGLPWLCPDVSAASAVPSKISTSVFMTMAMVDHLWSPSRCSRIGPGRHESRDSLARRHRRPHRRVARHPGRARRRHGARHSHRRESDPHPARPVHDGAARRVELVGTGPARSSMATVSYRHQRSRQLNGPIATDDLGEMILDANDCSLLECDRGDHS